MHLKINKFASNLSLPSHFPWTKILCRVRVCKLFSQASGSRSPFSAHCLEAVGNNSLARDTIHNLIFPSSIFTINMSVPLSSVTASQEVLGEAQATALNLISCPISIPGLSPLTVSKSAGFLSSPERLQVTGLFTNHSDLRV